MTTPLDELCKHKIIWCNPITGLYRCGISDEIAERMGIAPIPGCGKQWKDAMLTQEVNK